ncbi:MAG: glycosyltransferase family 4 protein [Thermoleophilaceae bacterium]
MRSASEAQPESYQRASNDAQYDRALGTPEREHPKRTEEPRLRIAMLAPPWIPVPPPGYGGIEYVVAMLTDALVDHGHDVELYCAPGSNSKARIHTILDAAHPEAIERALFEADHVGRALDGIDPADSAEQPFDVLHDNSGYVALTVAHRLRTPFVHTEHNKFDEDTGPYYLAHGHKGWVVCISHAQASMAPGEGIVDAIVHNPIDVDAWPVGLRKEEYLLWLGRIVPEKGPHRAIRVARATGRRLILAGPVQPRHERFFADEIQPQIDGDQISWVGEVGGARKQRLFADAYAFLMPITWPEPFGMVMVESLAAGTPVLAFNNGAAPEIVQHGVNGFLVENEQEMAAMVPSAAKINPMDCRRSAERFAPDWVAARYEAVYRQAVAREAAVR